MKKNRTIYGVASSRDAQRQFAELNSAIRGLRDNMQSLHRGLHAVQPHGSRRYTKTVNDRLSVLEQAGKSAIGNFFAQTFLSDVGLTSGGRFNASSSQLSSSLMQSLLLGQRNN